MSVQNWGVQLTMGYESNVRSLSLGAISPPTRLEHTARSIVQSVLTASTVDQCSDDSRVRLGRHIFSGQAVTSDHRAVGTSFPVRVLTRPSTPLLHRVSDGTRYSAIREATQAFYAVT